MFEVAELGQSVSKDEYQEQVPGLRERLLNAQARLRTAPFPVIVLFHGVDGAGKGASANLLNEWMDPHWVMTRAFGAPTEEERERPPYWRYWRDLPPRGHLGVFLKAWYSDPLLRRAYGEITDAELDERLDKIVHFERTLAEDGAVIHKFWMHLGRDQQERRLKTLSADPTTSWKVAEQDWKHLRMYDQFTTAAEQIIMRTNRSQAPWTIVEGEDERYRNLKVATTLLGAVERGLEGSRARKDVSDKPAKKTARRRATVQVSGSATVLDRLDLDQQLTKEEYQDELELLQAKLNLLSRTALERRFSTLLVFEGWDAAGKGGAIRRIITALDARHYEITMIAAPTDEERAHHYLWRFWRHLPRAGRFTIFDRSWYGRVLVERLEGYARPDEWRRAYGEINDFEHELADHGMLLCKFWLHISKREQRRRFKKREKIGYKRWKLTEEDWRNRKRWKEYEIAVNDMIERTSTRFAPWTLVEAENKYFARIKVLRTVCTRLEEALGVTASDELKLVSGEAS